MRTGSEVHYDCIVIGAGPGGLVATKELIENGMTNVLCIDRATGIGGVFIDTYDGLQLTSSVFYSMFSDFVGESLGGDQFWTKEKMVEYWEQYAAHFGVRERVRLGTTVTGVSDDGQQWTVAIEGDDALTCDRLVVATGANQTPSYPEWADQLTSVDVEHSKTYRNGDKYAGRNVVMVGGGESGSDVALQVSEVAENAWISLRGTAGWITPRLRGGRATDISTHRGIWTLPRTYGAWLSNRIRTFDTGTGEAYNVVAADLNGTITAKNGIWGTYGTKTFALPQAVVDHGCEIVDEIVEVRDGGRTLVTAKGTILDDVDAVVFSTGFNTAQPFLPDEIADIDSRSLFKHMFHADYGDRIAWVGRARPGFGSQFPIMEMQARYFALLATGKATLPNPTERNRSAADDAARYIEQFEHNAERIRALVDYFVYMDAMADLIGCTPPFARYLVTKPDLWRRMVYGPNQATQFRLAGPGAKKREAETILAQMPTISYNHIAKAGMRARATNALPKPLRTRAIARMSSA